MKEKTGESYPKYAKVMIKYVIPVIMTLVFSIGLYNEFKNN